MLCLDMLTSKTAMAKHIEFLHGMDNQPNSCMCIYCGMSNTNKKEVDKHIMYHTRGEKQLDWEQCEKAFTQ